MTMLSRLHHLVKQGSQFLIATHSPILMAYPNSMIYQLGDAGYESVEYTQTEHYAVAKQFLNNHEKILHTLLADEG
jgi:predicted ATPase